MRCLIVSSRHHPGQGGIGAFVQAQVEGAIEAGWHVELITRPSEHLPSASRVHCVTTPDDEPGFSRRVDVLRSIERIRPYRYGVWSLAVAECLIRQAFEVDVVQFMDVQAEGLVSILSGEVRRRFEGVPFVVSAHCPMFLIEELAGRDTNRFGRSIYHAWERAALRAADGVIGVSDLLLDEIGPFRNQLALPPILRGEVRSIEPPRRRTIAMIGDVQWHKGVDVWARSLNRVFRGCDDVQAVLVGGDTPSGPGGMSMAVHARNLIEPVHRHRFRYLGRQSHEGAMAVIDRASLVVLPSRFDSCPQVAVEALQRGRPVIVSDRVGLGQWIEGLPTVPADDAAALAEKQIELLESEGETMANVARFAKQMQSRFSPERILPRYERYVRSLTPRVEAPDSRGDVDAIERMRSFLRGVVRRERQFHGSPTGEPMKVP